MPSPSLEFTDWFTEFTFQIPISPTWVQECITEFLTAGFPYKETARTENTITWLSKGGGVNQKIWGEKLGNGNGWLKFFKVWPGELDVPMKGSEIFDEEEWLIEITFEKEPVEEEWVELIEGKFKDLGVEFREKERKGDVIVWVTKGTVGDRDSESWGKMVDEFSWCVGCREWQ